MKRYTHSVIALALLTAACTSTPQPEIDCTELKIMSYMKDGSPIYADPEPSLGGTSCRLPAPAVLGEIDLVDDRPYDHENDDTPDRPAPDHPSKPAPKPEDDAPSKPDPVSEPEPNDTPVDEPKKGNNGGGNGSEGSSPGQGHGANDDETV